MALIAAFLVILLPMAVVADDHDILSPPFPPSFEKICEAVECGKGTCKGDITYPYKYVCECDAGWKRSKDDDDSNDDLKFLPCLIPNCSLDYSCQTAPPPVPKDPKPVPLNTSVFDACYWMYCGEGTCKQTTTYKHECECKSGYSNLLNKPYFPCYSDCAIGSDCSSLGITVSNTRTRTKTNAGKAASLLPDKLQWLVVPMMCIGMAFWK